MQVEKFSHADVHFVSQQDGENLILALEALEMNTQWVRKSGLDHEDFAMAIRNRYPIRVNIDGREKRYQCHRWSLGYGGEREMVLLGCWNIYSDEDVIEYDVGYLAVEFNSRGVMRILPESYVHTKEHGEGDDMHERKAFVHFQMSPLRRD